MAKYFGTLKVPTYRGETQSYAKIHLNKAFRDLPWICRADFLADWIKGLQAEYEAVLAEARKAAEKSAA